METAKPATATVQLCCDAFYRVYQAEYAKRDSNHLATEAASQAFRRAMPFLTGPEIVNDFIACVTHGILLGAIESPEASKLLYAAQIVLTAQRRQPAETKSIQTKPAETKAPQPSAPPAPPSSPQPSPAPAASPAPPPAPPTHAQSPVAPAPAGSSQPHPPPPHTAGNPSPCDPGRPLAPSATLGRTAAENKSLAKTTIPEATAQTHPHPPYHR
jgi:outer membrane biosynthesis protein TonB